jgi:glycosyltransferase involved in cell wall biosynthesis
VKLLFIGVAASDGVLRETMNRYYGGRAEVRPQQHFDFAVAKGLAESCEIVALSEPPIASFPRSSCILYRHAREELSPSLSIIYLPLVNLPMLKTVLVFLQILLRALRFCGRGGDDRAILMGYISAYTALPALTIARAFGIPVFAVVPDLPRLMATYGTIRNPLRRLGLWLGTPLTRYVEPRFDGYVFLAGAMNQAINRKDRPFIIVEGMFDERGLATVKREPKEPRKTVMYAGTVHRKYGIKALVEAFLRPELTGVDLWVFGNGDYLEELRAVSATAPNIIYRGVVGRDEVFRFEQRATLLVNPRPTSDEFTRYSFPSKTLEYMASGTPLASTRLAGIPAEYFEHLYWFDDESGPGMARRIVEILEQPPDVIEAKGERARAFVLGSKTTSIQAARISAFIRSHR